MIHFFRDVLDGPVYFVLFVVCIILIMSILGFIMERLKLQKEENDKRVVVGGTASIEPVRTREVILSTKEEPVVEPVQSINQEPISSPTSTTPTTPTTNNTVVIPNMLDEELKREPTLTLDSSSVNVVGTEIEEPKPQIKAEDVATIIDFGTTSSIESNNQDNQN